MRRAIHQAVNRARLLLLAVALPLGCVPTAHALRSPAPFPTLDCLQPGLRLSEEMLRRDNASAKTNATYTDCFTKPPNKPPPSHLRAGIKAPAGCLHASHTPTLRLPSSQIKATSKRQQSVLIARR